MQQVDLTVQRRETGKKAVKILRSNKQVPGIYYDKNESIPFSVKSLDLRPIIYTSETHIINLSIEGDVNTKQAVVKEIKFDPVTDHMIHLDLVGLASDHKMTIDVPIVLRGQAIGVREGGVLQHTYHKLTVHCMPADIPTSIDIEISNLAIGKSIYVKNLDFPNVEFNLGPDTALVSVVPPRVSKEAGKE